MRLLYYTIDGELCWTKDFIDDDEIPPYAILSHTWQDGVEVTYDDLRNNTGKSKASYDKILFCAERAKCDSLTYFWVDTCCIDKSNHVEIQHAINSMFRWYQRARVCYVYLVDVSLSNSNAYDGFSESVWVSNFKASRWFKRGWTLQELLGPRSVKFYTPDGNFLGDKDALQQQIHETTGIPVLALQGASLQEFSVEERMSWAAQRKTTYKEDKVYSLLGIFGVYMLSNYGEGEENALRRLQKKLKKSLGRNVEENPAGNVHWIVPRTVNSLFTGRSELVCRIQNALRNDDLATTKQKRLVITGLGGMGKSEVCLKVANLMREEFWGVFWVDVDSQSTAKKGFLSIAKALESAAESVEEALQALANTKKPWLLILDNADNPSFDYTHYIPSGVKGVVVMTSRIAHCSKYSTLPAEALESLEVGHSTQLLFKAAQVPEETWQFSEQQAHAILRLLGSHTLALIQAGAYIAEGYCRLDQYPDRYQRQRKRLLKHYPEQEQSRYRDVYATFEASADILKSSNTEAGQDALDILEIMAMLQSSDLPIQVFADAWRGARDVLETEHTQVDDVGNLTQWHISQLPQFCNMQADGWDDYRLNKALALLASLSLVTRHSLHDLDGLSMHPLAHAWAKDRLGQEQQQTAWVKVGCLLALSRDESNRWQGYEGQLWPHVQSFLSPSVDSILSYGPLEMILPILLKCAWVLDTMREDDALKFLLEGIYRVLQIAPSNPSQEHIQIWNLAATSLTNSGHARQAVVLLEYTVKVRESTLKETHPDRLNSQHELARVYIDNGQTNEAVALLEHVVKVRESTLKETHPDRLASQHVLARAYNSNGQTNKAVALMEHVVKVEETTLKETHPDRLASQHMLANAYNNNGQSNKAVALLEHVVKVEETTLKETHPDRLASQHALANAYNNNGQTREAVALLEHVVKVEETTLSETHPDRLASQHLLAIAYIDIRHMKEAVALLEHVVKVRESTLQETHPNRLASQHMLASAYNSNGQTNKAVALLEHVVKVEETTLTETHPHRLASQHELARAYNNNGQPKEAVALLEHIVKIEETTLAATHPSRRVSVLELARIQSRIEQLTI